MCVENVGSRSNKVVVSVILTPFPPNQRTTTQYLSDVAGKEGHKTPHEWLHISDDGLTGAGRERHPHVQHMNHIAPVMQTMTPESTCIVYYYSCAFH